MKTLYVCEGCGTQYDTADIAMACETQMITSPLQVGDIVSIGKMFGWHDGDDRWIEQYYPSDGAVSLRTFYYVVSHITTENHRVWLYCATRAMSEESGYRCGYTHYEGHYLPRKVEQPSPYIVETSKALIGMLSKSLL